MRPLREDLVTQACLEAYGAVRHEGRLADRALEFTLRTKKHLYSTERRAVAERVYHLLRCQRLVDWLLERKASGFGGWPSTRQDLFRIALSRALGDEAPKQVTESLGMGINETKLLTELLKERSALSGLSTLERFALVASVPDFLAKRFVDELGDEAEALAQAMNVRGPLTVRTNVLKTDRPALLAQLRAEDVDAKPCVHSPFGIVLDTHLNAFSLPSFKAGLFEIQDEGSQLLGMLVDAPPRKVVDACAGAGGKTLQLAAQMKNRGELFALDIDERRLEDLRARARRAGAHNIRVKAIPTDATDVSAMVEPAERVLVDAPCSGTGTFRRKPDARYRLTEERLAEHVERQKMLLKRFAVLVKPKGRLIYGTCSVLREENEGVIEAFLAEHPQFAVKNAEQWLGEPLKDCVRNGFLRLYPHRHGTDGFFGAVLERSAT